MSLTRRNLPLPAVASKLVALGSQPVNGQGECDECDNASHGCFSAEDDRCHSPVGVRAVATNGRRSCSCIMEASEPAPQTMASWDARLRLHSS